MLRRPIAAALAAALVAATLPATVTADRRVYALRSVGSQDGLGHDIVRDVLAARDGTIWFGTMSGVTRYHPSSGRYERLAALGGKRVMALAQGARDVVWVATQGGGLLAMRGERVTARYGAGSGLPSDEVTYVFVTRAGDVWALATTGGAARLRRGRWRRFGPAEGLQPSELSHCVELRRGPLLCAAYHGAPLWRFDGAGRWSPMPVHVPGLRRHFYVHSMAEGLDGTLWLATKGVGAIAGTPVAGKPESYRWVVHRGREKLPSDRVGDVHVAHDGAVWLATAAGVTRFDGKAFKTLDRRDGLGANLVFRVRAGRGGALWLATLGGGAARYAPTGWRTADTADGLPSDLVTSLLVAGDGALWAGTDHGLARRRSGAKRFAHLPLPPPPPPAPPTTRPAAPSGRAPAAAARRRRPAGPPSAAAEPELRLRQRQQVNHLLEHPRGVVWIATRDGVGRWQAGSWRWFGRAAGLPHRVALRLARGDNNDVWVATPRGAARIRDHTVTAARGAGLPRARVYDVHVDSAGALWLATARGLASRARGAARWVSWLSPSRPSRTARIYRVVEPRRGELWASTLDGAHRRPPGGKWAAVDLGPWLPAGIYSRFAMATADGSLWFAVRGLGVWRRAGRHDAPLWAHYTSQRGLAGDTVTAVASRADGTLLFATLGGGISTYHPDRHAPDTWVGASRRAPGPRVVQAAQLALSFGGQDALRGTPSRRLLFSYRLDGGRWSQFSRARVAKLSGLGAGEHRFEVRAMDGDLNVDPTPALHVFRVVRPWWAQPWLLALIAATALLLIYGGVRSLRAAGRERVAVSRERQAVQREQAVVEQRRRFVRLASHELRKPLTRLAHRAEMLSLPATRDNPERLDEYTAAITRDSGSLAELVEALLSQARLEGLAIDARVADLRAVVRKTVADASSDSPTIALELPDEPVSVEHDALYLAQALANLLDNAQKYGADPISVRLVTDGGASGGARITVHDSGPGIALAEREQVFEEFHRGRTKPEHGGLGLGLPFAREIARAHGGDLALDDSVDSGCAFVLSLPLADAADAR